MRSIIHVLTLRITGESRILTSLDRSELTGIGLSDWAGYADRLQDRFNYINSFYHQEPLLDIATPSERWIKTANFLISTDVFEHVPPAPFRAFEGAAKVLKPGGLIVMTVPYGDNEQTIEHYPDLATFEMVDLGGEWVLLNKKTDGTIQLHRNLIFHGGPGTTLEMRLFSKAAVIADLERAGFRDVRVHDETVPAFGVFPPHHYGLPISAILDDGNSGG